VAVLLFISIGYIGVSVMEHPVELSVNENTAHETEEGTLPAAQGYARRIPFGQAGKSNASKSTTTVAALDNPPKLDHKKQLNLVDAMLQRRFDPQSAVERKDKLSMPEWDKIINPGGTLKDDVNEDGMFGSNGIPDYIDLYRGVDADFIQDNISNGLATDMSALLPGPRLEDEVLYNGAVRREHDLGNAYVLATIGADNHLRLYAGVERLVSDAVTYIEIEFNQNPVRLGGGSPWPVIGKREEGDLLVRMVFANRALQSVGLEQWHQGGFNVLKTGAGIAGDSCLQKLEFMYCVGLPPIRHSYEEFEVWDEEYNLLDPTSPDNFVEIGVDIDLLVGSQADITSVLFRTPEDIAMNNFRVFEKLAQLDEPVMSKTSLTKRK
jgi:hypothetical protein